MPRVRITRQIGAGGGAIHRIGEVIDCTQYRAHELVTINAGHIVPDEPAVEVAAESTVPNPRKRVMKEALA